MRSCSDRRGSGRRLRWPGMRSSPRLAVGLAALVGCGPIGCLTAASAGRLEVELRIELAYEDREFGIEGYTATYVHRSTVSPPALRFDTAFRNISWSGWERCTEPPLTVDWQSGIDFDDFAYDEPELIALRRGEEIWLLYEPAREFGVEHSGRPACDAFDAIAPGTWVTKNFFSADLAEQAQPAGDFPVYAFDDKEATGGLVLAVISGDDLDSGPHPIDITYEADTDLYRLAFRAIGSAERLSAR